jgi:hypothetical protein
MADTGPPTISDLRANTALLDGEDTARAAVFLSIWLYPYIKYSVVLGTLKDSLIGRQ